MPFSIQNICLWYVYYLDVRIPRICVFPYSAIHAYAKAGLRCNIATVQLNLTNYGAHGSINHCIISWSSFWAGFGLVLWVAKASRRNRCETQPLLKTRRNSATHAVLLPSFWTKLSHLCTWACGQDLCTDIGCADVVQRGIPIDVGFRYGSVDHNLTSLELLKMRTSRKCASVPDTDSTFSS